MTEKAKALLRFGARPNVSKNDLANAINEMQDGISKFLGEKPKEAKSMYELILGNLKTSNERLWFTASLRLGKIYLDEKDFDNLEKSIKELKEHVKDPNNPHIYDMNKSNLALEVLALEIQMCSLRGENRRMRQVFRDTEQFKSVIEDNRVTGIIKECGGKMYMSERNWKEALMSFWEGFVAMVDSGHPSAVNLLKYVILTQLLSQETTEYLTQQEAMVFKNDPQIVAMTDLKNGFHKNDI